MQWSELLTLYDNDATKLPDRVLYNWLNDSRELLAKASGEDFKAFQQSGCYIEVARRTQTNLYFLAKYFLWETNPECNGRSIDWNKMNRETHQRLCDMFIKKDPRKTLDNQGGEGFRDRRKERLILYPRGTFKSTIDVADTVQWILIFPEIRVLFLTAADDLASGFVSETKGHFLRREPVTLMNIFYPEHCAVEDELKKEDMYSFTCPIWRAKQIRRKEPTVMAMSITSTLSGWHYDVIKSDDVVSNRNSENEEQCKKIVRNIGINIKMLRAAGYHDMIGTRYSDVDWYGDTIEKNVGDIVRSEGPCWEIIENKTSGLKILIGRAWQLKPESKERMAKGLLKDDDLAENSYDLLFPTGLSYAFLHYEQRLDEVSFEGQYCNNPRPSSKTIFELPLLQSKTIPFRELPISGPISITWDFAFSKKKGRDYSTASVAIWNDKGQMFIVDLIRARFKPNDLSKAVVDLARKWRPYIIGIENAAGSRLLESSILDEAKKTGLQDVMSVCGKIDWFNPDTQKDAKTVRMGALHPWLVNDRMFFASHLPHLSVLYDEFQKCMTSHHHDDIPDVLGFQPNYAPFMRQLIDKKEIVTVSKEQAAWNVLFEEGADAFGRVGVGGAPMPQPVVQLVKEDETRAESPEGLDPILGAGIYG